MSSSHGKFLVSPNFRFVTTIFLEESFFAITSSLVVVTHSEGPKIELVDKSGWYCIRTEMVHTSSRL